jgi:hypothetical protein
LLAVNLVIIAALITVGPVDAAVQIAVTAFACALPLDVAGIVLLRLVKDVEGIRLDDLALKAFQKAGFPDITAYFPPARERHSLAKRRARIALGYAFAIALLSVTLTLTGVAAALWHMAPWVAETFAATVVFSTIVLGAVAAHAMPPETAAEQELKRRYREEHTRHGEPA